jgi:hypothetical protein
MPNILHKVLVAQGIKDAFKDWMDIFIFYDLVYQPEKIHCQLRGAVHNFDLYPNICTIINIEKIEMKCLSEPVFGK